MWDRIRKNADIFPSMDAVVNQTRNWTHLIQEDVPGYMYYATIK
jgi:hypothetical protein